MVAALRNYKASICHYLRGVEGCGDDTSNKIRSEFAKTIAILTQRLRYENNNVRLCHLLNAFLW